MLRRAVESCTVDVVAVTVVAHALSRISAEHCTKLFCLTQAVQASPNKNVHLDSINRVQGDGAGSVAAAELRAAARRVTTTTKKIDIFFEVKIRFLMLGH